MREGPYLRAYAASAGCRYRDMGKLKFYDDTADDCMRPRRGTTMEKSKIRVIYEYEFRRGTTVSETARNINAVFGEGSTTKATVGNWFKNFRDGDFSLANEPRGRPKTKLLAYAVDVHGLVPGSPCTSRQRYEERERQRQEARNGVAVQGVGPPSSSAREEMDMGMGVKGRAGGGEKERESQGSIVTQFLKIINSSVLLKPFTREFYVIFLRLPWVLHIAGVDTRCDYLDARCEMNQQLSSRNPKETTDFLRVSQRSIACRNTLRIFVANSLDVQRDAVGISTRNRSERIP
ncbi:hypothetical protein DMN91_002324 [Ooceraea biroi]|uniref:Mos1 transposase HTH domain-containing protein n=1 Tax=Ooceraea biroi TaxID=2015173 RepID=A0A3L8E2E6_OOCBI|nr:hypothetical protein DMN91_002324 [Ooceraea biroi]